MKLNSKALGIALGAVWALTVFAATAWVLAGPGQGMLLQKLGRFYPGYSVSALGALIGLVEGFVHMFITGWLIGWIYNMFSKK
ncbi:hypothetical protein JXA40_05025 [bacterium]|nr:hypothetical protein [candidate division CSSED10-310 bacterium]